MRIAQRFNAWIEVWLRQVPKGRLTSQVRRTSRSGLVRLAAATQR